MVRFISILLFWLCLFSLANNNLSANSTTKKFVVVIDAGHGGNDPGAVGKKAKEKTINLNTALKLGKLIEQQCKDVKVVYTRKTDVFIPLNKRAQIANNAKADLFISIHTNALPKGKITFGAETYTLGMARADENLEVAKKENSVILMEDDYKQTYKGFNPNSPESYIIFEFMQDKNMSQSINFAKKIQQQFKRAGRTDKGVHQAGFLVLRETAMPSVLVELGYISTPKEESFLNSSDGTSKMANSIFQAFNEYRKNHESIEPNPDKVVTQAPVVAEEAPGEDTDMELHPIRDNSHVMRSSQQPANGVKESQVVSAVAVTTAAKTADKPAAKTAEKPAGAKAAKANGPVFKVQILTSPTQLKTTDRQFKGLKGVEFYRESNKYKYTYGASTDYNEILKLKKEITSKFADCFIIAFRNGEKMNVNEAIALFKKQHNKR